MTHTRRTQKFRYYAAFVGWLVLVDLCVYCTMAQDMSINEVVPFLGGAKRNTTSSHSGRVVVCPSDPPNVLTRLLGVNCERSADCQFLGQDQRCCRNICRRGMEPPIYEPPHGDVLGIRRKCPSYTFPERLPVKRCSKDEDCEGLNRICCPDKKDRKLYCRTAAPLWSELPIPDNRDTLKTLVGFVQCQSPPPAVIDIFARPCNRTVDCLPNLCCQEGSKKVCRPPKRSILSLAAQATSRFIRG